MKSKIVFSVVLFLASAQAFSQASGSGGIGRTSTGDEPQAKVLWTCVSSRNTFRVVWYSPGTYSFQLAGEVYNGKSFPGDPNGPLPADLKRVYDSSLTVGSQSGKGFPSDLLANTNVELEGNFALKFASARKGDGSYSAKMTYRDCSLSSPVVDCLHTVDEPVSCWGG